MGTELRYPNWNARTESEKQLHSYLHQLIDQLQFALDNVGSSSTASIQPAQRVAQQSSSGSSSPSVDFSSARGDLSLMPLPRDQVSDGWNPDNLGNGIHVIANNNALKTGDTVIMYNGVLVQMPGTVDGSVKLQLALPVDEDRNPMYRLCWYSKWSAWRSLKL